MKDHTATTPALLCYKLTQPLYLDVANEECIRVQALKLCIRLGIFQEVEQEFSALLRPAPLPNLVALILRLASAPNAT
jgi:hypothetical protein